MADLCNIPELPPYHGAHDPCNDLQRKDNWGHVDNQFRMIRENMLKLRNCLRSGGQVRFRLDATLALGGSAAGVVQRLVADSGDPGNPDAWFWEDDPNFAPIVVFDDETDPGRWMGVAGYQGWCVSRPSGSNHYSIRELDEIAQEIEYTAAGHLVGSSVTASVTRYFNGQNPGVTVTVHDPDGQWRYWHRYGCKGKAKWSRDNARYEISFAEKVAKRWFGELKYPVCKDFDPEEDQLVAENIRPYEQADYQVKLYEFEQTSVDPDPVVFEWVAKSEVDLTRWTERHGNPGEPIIFEGYLSTEDDVSELKWEWEIVRNTETPIVTSFVWNDDSCTIKGSAITAWVETCGEGAADVAIPIPFQQWPMIESFFTDSNLDHDHPLDPAFSYCNLWAQTGIYCAIRVGDGAPILVDPQQYYEVLVNFTLVNLQEEPNTEYVIRLNWDYIAARCYETPASQIDTPLRRQDITYEFELFDDADADPASCVITAHSKESWLFDLPPGVVNEGVDIDVLTAVEQRVVTDVFIDGDDLKEAITNVFVICKDEKDDEVWDIFEDCP